MRTVPDAALSSTGEGCPAVSVEHPEPVGQGDAAVETHDEPEACVELRYGSIVD